MHIQGGIQGAYTGCIYREVYREATYPPGYTGRLPTHQGIPGGVQPGRYTRRCITREVYQECYHRGIPGVLPTGYTRDVLHLGYTRDVLHLGYTMGERPPTKVYPWVRDLLLRYTPG